MKEAYLYEKLADKNTRCKNCAHYCVIAPNQRGICGKAKIIEGFACSR